VIGQLDPEEPEDPLALLLVPGEGQAAWAQVLEEAQLSELNSTVLEPPL
jgi:hypothetical protein